MQKLKQEEAYIFAMLDDSDQSALAAFDKLSERLSDDDEMQGTAKLPIFVTIYIDRYDDCYLWKSAVNNNVSERTFYRYRHEFIDWFHFYYKKAFKQSSPAA